MLFVFIDIAPVCRTKMLKCSSDTEYLAKLYCVRAAFQVGIAPIDCA